MLEDARKLSDYFSFDKILLDAPGSGSGTENIFDKNFSKELVERSVKFQEELLNKALKILKPGGEMVYSTRKRESFRKSVIKRKCSNRTNNSTRY